MKKVITILLSALVILSAAALCIWLPRDRTVLIVDGTEVTESEFLMIFENEIRAEMLSLAPDDAQGNPWAAKHEGTTIKQLALSATCEKIYEYVAWQQLFKEYGVYDWTYDNFKKAYKEKQKNAYSESEIQYGTQSYTTYDYYVYLHSIYRLQVIEKLKDDNDAQAIYDYYVANGEQFRDTDVIVFDRYSIEKNAENAQVLLKNAAEGKSATGVSKTQITIDAYSSKYDDGLGVIVDLGDNLEKMRQNGAEIFTQNETELLFFRTVSYEQGEIKPYSECEETVSDRFYDDKYLSLTEDKLTSQNTQTTRYFEKIELY